MTASLDRRASRLALLLLALFTAAQLVALNRDSPTVDEPAHLARGYSYLRTGDLRLHIGHPPLVGMWAALPLLADPSIQLPLNAVSWQKADRIEFPITLFWKSGNPALAMFRAGRIMIILFGVLLGATLYRLAADLGGHPLGLAALTLYVFDPNLRAHARLITTDLGVTLWLTACLWLSLRLLRHPHWRLALAGGVAFGLALASKYTALVVVPALGLVLLWNLRRRPTLRITYFAATALTVWAIYRFEFRPALGLAFPIPLASYFEELRFSLADISGTPTYLMGQVSRAGFYSYFFVALLVKTPLPLLLLALTGIARPRGMRHPDRVRALAVVGFPLAFYFALTVASRVNIGYRHLLPVWPLLYLGGALGLVQLARHPLGRWLGGLALAWLVFNTATTYPRDLTFFNELAGGPAGGHRFLVDSNLDWGQDLGELAAYARAHHLEPLHLSYFGSTPVMAFPIKDFNLQSLPLPPVPAPDWQPLHPAPGWYAISVTHLFGGAVLDNPDTFSFFQHRQPDVIIGHTIYLYHVLPETDTVAVCINPPPAMPAADIRAAFGPALTRLIPYDCSAGLPLPAGPTQYLFRGEQAALNAEALARLGAQLIYAEPHRADPRFAFSLYQLAEPAARAAYYPDHPVAPQIFGGLVTFTGYRYPSPLRPGPPAQVETVWQIQSVVTQPVSLFLHLTAPDGFLLASSDGLNTPVDALLPGDGLIQLHTLDYPTGLPDGARWATGLYALTPNLPRYLLPDGGDQFVFFP